MTTQITTSQTTQQLALNNELFVKQLENALKDAHLPPNSLREMIINVNKSLVCDQKCQEKKTIDQLKIDWTKEKNNVNQSENNLETLRAKYFQAAKSDDYYKTNILIPEFKAKITKQINNYNMLFFTDHLANLLNVCEDCHQEFHKLHPGGHKKVKTSKGYELKALPGAPGIKDPGPA